MDRGDLPKRGVCVCVLKNVPVQTACLLGGVEERVSDFKEILAKKDEATAS